MFCTIYLSKLINALEAVTAEIWESNLRVQDQISPLPKSLTESIGEGSLPRNESFKVQWFTNHLSTAENNEEIHCSSQTPIMD